MLYGLLIQLWPKLVGQVINRNPSLSSYNIIQKKLLINKMYYLQSPFLYQYQGQLFMFPPIVPAKMMFEESIDKKQFDSQDLSEQKKLTKVENEQESPQNKNISPLLKSSDSKQLKQTFDSDYQPQKNEVLIFYKKKNTESNLSNQIYSYISCSKSMDLMLRLFDGNPEKVEEFYKLIKKIKKTNKKYMNRSYISELVNLKEGSTNFKIYKRSKCFLEAEEIRKALRISYRYFLLNVCDSGLLTSKKMNKDTLMEHFSRKREIMDFLSQQLCEMTHLQN